MKYEEFKKILEEVKEQPFYRIMGVTSDEQLIDAQNLLGIKFSKQHRYFLKTLGTLSFSGYEFYGICKAGLNVPIVPCSIGLTIHERKKSNLDSNLIVLFSNDDGYFGCLNYGSLNENAEPSVVLVLPIPKKTVIIDTIASDFGEYIKKCIKNSN